MLEFLFIIVSIISIYCFVVETYSLFLSFFGYKKLEKYYKDHDPKTKFLILVPAYEEDAIIEGTLENLSKIEYPKELYDLVIVNDSPKDSNDKTSQICNRLGIKHVNTSESLFPREGVGKSAGLQYALRYLGFEDLKDKYDMMLVLDADNHVDSNILAELNSQWIDEDKPTAIQAYLDSKNADSVIATGYATSYNITNRFFQLSKKRLGLNNAIGGTGFAVRMDWLINTGGFCYDSLVEDLEMSIKIFEDGGNVSWNHFTRIYDEKPDNLKVSIKQRIRWCQGHWYVAFTNAGILLNKLFKSKPKDILRCIDQLLYLFNMGKAIQLVVLICSAILSFVVILFVNANIIEFNLSTVGNFFLNLIVPANILRGLMMFYVYAWLPIYANKIDGTHKASPIKIITSVFIVGVTYIYTQIVGLLKWRNQGTWVKTPHVHKNKQ